jgi:hypothetical protein
MARKPKKDKQVRIEPGTPEMEMLLQAGYPFTIKEAEVIVKEYEAGATHLMSEAKLARAMLEAYKAKPQVISETPGWERKKVPT